MNEVHEKQLRIRYIRVLEKFLTRTISLLKLENFDANLFRERTLKNFKDVEKVKEMDLNSTYLTNLRAFINKVMSNITDVEGDFTSKKEGLLKDANLLQKEKNQGSYKKDKHKNQKFDDGY